jgi:predicted transcriptional regulator
MERYRRQTPRELILAAITARPGVSQRDLRAALPALSSRKVYRLLNILIQEGLIERSAYRYHAVTPKPRLAPAPNPMPPPSFICLPTLAQLMAGR